MRFATALLALTSAGCSQIAMASTITEFNRASFQTALSSAMLSGQNFDSLPLGTIVTVNGVTYTILGYRRGDELLSNDNFPQRPRLDFARFLWD